MSPFPFEAMAIAATTAGAALVFLSGLLAGGALGLALAGRGAEGDEPLRRRLAALAGLLAAAALALLPLSLASAWLSTPGDEALASWRRAFGPSWLLLVMAAAVALQQRRSFPSTGAGPRHAPLLGWALALATLAVLAATVLARSALEVPGRAAGVTLDGTLAPSLLVRALAAAATGGALLLAAGGGADAARRRVARLAALLGLPAALLLPAGAWLWFRTAPAAWETVQASPGAAAALRLAAAAAALGAFGLGAGTVLSARRPALASPWAAATLLALAFLATAGAEAARAPLLSPPPAPLPRAPVDQPDGQAIFAARCRGCHTLAGPRGVRRHLDGRSLDQVATVLHTLEKRHGHAPYPGPDAERLVLARWLAGLDGIVEPEGVEAGDFLSRGRKVMEGFCLSCHVLDGPPSKNPLRPKVRGWTQDLAYQTVGRLSRMNPGMIDYDGPDADRQALAAWLAVVGSEGGP